MYTKNRENRETSNRWYQNQEKKEEQVQNTQTLKFGEMFQKKMLVVSRI